jgi:uncharacterized membrane protein (DUF441 family)
VKKATVVLITAIILCAGVVGSVVISEVRHSNVSPEFADALVTVALADSDFKGRGTSYESRPPYIITGVVQ